MAQALGARLLDADGNQIGPGGASLVDLASIDLTGLDPRSRLPRSTSPAAGPTFSPGRPAWRGSTDRKGVPACRRWPHWRTPWQLFGAASAQRRPQRDPVVILTVQDLPRQHGRRARGGRRRLCPEAVPVAGAAGTDPPATAGGPVSGGHGPDGRGAVAEPAHATDGRGRPDQRAVGAGRCPAEVFLRNPGPVRSREQLLSHVGGYDFVPGSNVVDVYVR